MIVSDLINYKSLKDRKFKFKFKQIFMEAPATNCQDSQGVQDIKNLTELPISQRQTPVSNSNDLLDKIYNTLNSPRNHRDSKPYKMSISIEDTHQTVLSKCNCKKSKCLKLYCQCFAQGSFCNGCNCACCQNTVQFSEIRAKAIDQVLIRALIPFGHKNSSIKGCNCRKTGCLKKYCQCYGSGDKCSEYCKCQNCENQ